MRCVTMPMGKVKNTQFFLGTSNLKNLRHNQDRRGESSASPKSATVKSNMAYSPILNWRKKVTVSMD